MQGGGLHYKLILEKGGNLSEGMCFNFRSNNSAVEATVILDDVFG